MIGDEFEIRISNRLKRKKENEEEEEFFPVDPSHFDIISIDDDQKIDESLKQLLSKDPDIQFSSLNSLARLSNFFPENVLKSLTSNHFNILYNFLENDEYKDFVIFIFSNLSKKKDSFNPPIEIFKTILNILLDIESDDTEILHSLNLTKNLVLSQKIYYSGALRYNIHQAIINNDKVSSELIKIKISALSAFLLYQNNDIEEDIFNYLIQDEFIQSNKASIYREIINGFEYALSWSYKAIQIINESNLISISTNLLISDKPKNVAYALSFLKKCMMTLEITNIQFVKFFVLVLAKDDEKEEVLKDIVLSFIIFVTQRSSSCDFLFYSLCEIGIDVLLAMKSFTVKKLFLSFLDESAKNCPKEVMIIPPNVLSVFLEEMILTREEDLQIISIGIIIMLFSSISDSGDMVSKWGEDFACSLAGSNILDIIYQSSIIDNPNISDDIDSLSSLLNNHDKRSRDLIL